jgi:hypothetical protein
LAKQLSVKKKIKDTDVNEHEKVDHVALGHKLKYIDNVIIAVLHFTVNK